MKIQSIVNGSVTIILEPETPVEEEILKVLSKQSCVVTEVRGSVYVLGRTIRGSVLIGPETYNLGSSEIRSEPNSDKS